jgi:cysteine desulfurase
MENKKKVGNLEKRIYVDYASTSPLKKEVLESMMPYLTYSFGNPSSIYFEGQEAKKAVETSREKIAEILNAKPDEIYFTSSGTESNNWSITGLMYANLEKGKHLITTNIEHHSVLNTCKNLENKGFKVTYLSVDKYGLINLEELYSKIRDDTILISIAFVNNEIGTMMPIHEIGEIAMEKGVIFHTDAVQAPGAIQIDVEKLKLDSLSLSGHKMYGPKGVGILYLRRGNRILNFMQGGAQEKNKRGGTENVAGIVGFSKALEISTENISEKISNLKIMRDTFISKIFENFDHVHLNGHPILRHPGNVNFSFEFIEGESLLLMLDNSGISASSGSACTSGSLDPSHVLLAIGLKHEVAHGSLRITFGEKNTMQDVDYIIEALKEIVPKLRSWSPLGKH